MAGTVAKTETTHRSVKRVKLAWTSDAAGAVSGTATDETYTGEILKAAFIPGSAGNQPTDNYDVVVNDADSVDVLAGAGANRSNASTQWVDGASLGAVVESALTLVVADAGNAKTGTVILYLR